MDTIHREGTLSDVVIRLVLAHMYMSGGGSPIPERFGSVPLLQKISNVSLSMYYEVNHTIINSLAQSLHMPGQTTINQADFVKMRIGLSRTHVITVITPYGGYRFERRTLPKLGHRSGKGKSGKKKNENGS